LVDHLVLAVWGHLLTWLAHHLLLLVGHPLHHGSGASGSHLLSVGPRGHLPLHPILVLLVGHSLILILVLVGQHMEQLLHFPLVPLVLLLLHLVLTHPQFHFYVPTPKYIAIVKLFNCVLGLTYLLK